MHHHIGVDEEHDLCPARGYTGIPRLGSPSVFLTDRLDPAAAYDLDRPIRRAIIHHGHLIG